MKTNILLILLVLYLIFVVEGMKRQFFIEELSTVFPQLRDQSTDIFSVSWRFFKIGSGIEDRIEL